MKNHKSLIINHKSIPIQYQKGYVEFYKLKFKVTPDVLIPRPETELLVDEVLNSIKYYGSSIKEKNILVVDVGTGSGNIAISIAKNTSGNIKIIACDISQKALKTAQQNAKLHGVENKIKFLKSDLLTDLNYTLYPIPYVPEEKESSAYTLIIVANLPYIPSSRIPYLDSSVKDFEPYVALNGGDDGFDLYRKLFKQIKKFESTPFRCKRKLKLLIGEIDYTHGELAVLEAQKYFPDAESEVKTDLAHKQRIVIIKLESAVFS